MDRSFLSRPEVIEASRAFVCIRLTTYENKEEGEMLKAMCRTGSGELENTVFAILAPDGKRQLLRATRSVRHDFSDASAMAQSMSRIARQVNAKPADGVPTLPAVANVRLAIDVAACDNLPLVVLTADSEKRLQSLQERVSRLAWSDEFMGRFTYAVASGEKDLAAISGIDVGSSLLVVQSDRFGLKGQVVSQLTSASSDEELARCLREGAARFKKENKTFQLHVRDGKQKGILWETAIPVTDPMELRARTQGRNR